MINASICTRKSTNIEPPTQKTDNVTQLLGREQDYMHNLAQHHTTQPICRRPHTLVDM